MERKYTYARESNSHVVLNLYNKPVLFLIGTDFYEIFSWDSFLKEDYLLQCRVEISIMSIEVTEVEKKLSFNFLHFPKIQK